MGRIARNHGSTDDVAVPVEILRGGVHHEVRAEREGPLERWREEGVIGHDQRARTMPGLAHGAQVRDPQQRIARRLDPQQVRARPRDDLLGIGRREVGELQRELIPGGRCRRNNRAPPGLCLPPG
jgi:hypothetical protein